ncbi:hypothetical protein QEN19_004004 [Hanseniaspora menglaensis]
MLQSAFKSITKIEKRFISDNAFNHQVATYARPSSIIVTSGKNVTLHDSINDKSYLDFTAGIAVTSLGHNNAEIAKIIAKQVSNENGLIHSSNLYYNQESLELAELMVKKTKASGSMHDAERVFFCNSGTEANEAAIKFAIKYKHEKNPSPSTEKVKFLAFQNSFHGRTMGALSVTYNSKYRAPFQSALMDVEFLSLSEIDTLSKKLDADSSIAGVIIEPIQGEGGVFPVPAESLISLKKQLSKHDIPLIYDEIQCGIGRSGKLWAHAHSGSEAHPDIITCAKALGNGYPIGAVIISDKINHSIKVGDHGTTFGGNALGCAVGKYVINTIADDKFLAEVTKKGNYLKELLNEKFVKKHPDVCNEVRGMGLMLGLDFKESPSKLVQKCQENGLLVITAGKSTVRFVPALTITKEEINHGLTIFTKCFNEIYS